MKKILYMILIAALTLSLGACTVREAQEETVAQEAQEETASQDTQEEPAVQEETATPDGDWDIPETTEMTDEASEMFDHAMEELTGVNYEPVGLLGEKDGVYCVLCRATVVYPDAKPYYALVYVNEDGLQNIWDIWMGAHAKKE